MEKRIGICLAVLAALCAVSAVAVYRWNDRKDLLSPPQAAAVYVLHGGDYKMDLNEANAELLSDLPGIGARLAERIVTYRETVGAFTCIDDLEQVEGIGKATVERLRPYVTVTRSIP